MTKNPDGTPTGEGFSKPYCYHIDQFESLRPVFMKVIEYASAFWENKSVRANMMMSFLIIVSFLTTYLIL